MSGLLDVPELIADTVPSLSQKTKIRLQTQLSPLAWQPTQSEKAPGNKLRYLYYLIAGWDPSLPETTQGENKPHNLTYQRHQCKT